MFTTMAGRATSLTATIVALVMFLGYVTMPMVAATPDHDQLAHTNTK